ncbi:hypothetical protein KM043_015287 [Ampulex compressa]|nr:hypothetical protein KM043_015287 [Ampulex compressa]
MNGPSVDVVWDPQTQMNSLDCWDYSIELACLQGPEDLQLAAELGKTLLERNKELESIIKIHQSTVEEQAQEIEYMKKQTAALREVNDSRLKIYEQLEVSIQDLERANHRLAIENSSDKKLIKSQCLTIENLEARCEELQKKIDELTEHCDTLQRQQAASLSSNTAQPQTSTWKGSVTPGGSIHQSAAPNSSKPFQEGNVDANVRQLATALANDEEMTELLRQLQEARSQRAREQKKVTELGQQLANLLQENSALEEQLNIWRSKAQDVKNLQEEISTLEEVKRGQLCGRCLRGMGARTHDELAVMLDQDEYDDISVAESLIDDSQHRESESLVQDTNGKSGGTAEDDYNPYRVLVEKYQALFEVQKQAMPRRKSSVPATCMSLQEELEMSGEFNFHNAPSEAGNQQESSKSVNANGPRAKTEVSGNKLVSATLTDFSEAETSSSGFSDETSNKATQTDESSGFFLCSIADGDDCKLSIYDDNSPLKSRFRKTQEYKQTFSEMYNALKRAAEAKDLGAELPLLNDSSSINVSQTQSMVQEDAPSETIDDNQSIMSSSMVSSIVSEPICCVQTPALKDAEQNCINDAGTTPIIKNGTAMVQAQKGPALEYVSIDVHVRKKSSAKKNSNRRCFSDRPTTPDIVPTANPKFIPPKSNGGGRKKFKPVVIPEQETTGCNRYNYANRTRESPNSGRRQNAYVRNTTDKHNGSSEVHEFKPSTASANVAQLKRIDMTYAEVLRTPNKSKVKNHLSS